MRLRCMLAAVALLVWGVEVSAHPAPFSYLDIVFRGGAIEGSLTVHIIDIAHELGISPPERLLDDSLVERERQRIGEILAPRIMLRSDHRLTVRWQSMQLMRDELALRLKYLIPNEDPGALTIDTHLFPYDPIHQTFVNIYQDRQGPYQLIFSANSNEHTYYRGTAQGALEVMKTFIPSGTHHILIGPDHILFLIGLLLLGGTWGALVRIVRAVTR